MVCMRGVGVRMVSSVHGKSAVLCCAECIAQSGARLLTPCNALISELYSKDGCGARAMCCSACLRVQGNFDETLIRSSTAAVLSVEPSLDRVQVDEELRILNQDSREFGRFVKAIRKLFVASLSSR